MQSPLAPGTPQPFSGNGAMMMPSAATPPVNGGGSQTKATVLLDVGGGKFEKVVLLAQFQERATVRGRDEHTKEVDAGNLVKLDASPTVSFVQNEEAFYEMGSRIERCRIVEVHQDAPDEPPYYTIKLSTGRPRTTDARHLLKAAAGQGGNHAHHPPAAGDDPFSDLVGSDVPQKPPAASDVFGA